MKKRILSLWLVFVLCLSLMPMSAFAAESIDVHANYESGSVEVTWEPVEGAFEYVCKLMNTKPDGTWAEMSYIPTVRVRHYEELKCLFSGFTTKYGNGGNKYKIWVTALASSEVIAEGESNEFEVNIPILPAPVSITLSQDGTVTCSSVTNASEYIFTLYNDTGHSAITAIDSDTNSYDFSEYLAAGSTYYASAFVRADGYRESAYVNSNTITVEGEKESISNIRWGGTTLQWDAFPGATDYYLWLDKKQSDGIFRQVGTAQRARRSTFFDFSEMISTYGYGEYMGWVQAVYGYENNPVSLMTESPVYTAEAPAAYTITVTGDGNPAAYYQGTPIGEQEAGLVVALKADSTYNGRDFDKWVSNDVVISDSEKAAGAYFTMPAKDVTVTATYKNATEPTITSVEVTPATATVAKGETKQFSAVVSGTGAFDDAVTWSITGGDLGTNISSDGLLSIADYNTEDTITVKATSVADPSKYGTATVTLTDATKYTVTVLNDGNGTASATPTSAVKDSTVTLNASPNAGYHFKEWQSSDVTISSNNTFAMPEKNVTVKAIFEQDTPAPVKITKVAVTGVPTPVVGASTAISASDVTITTVPADAADVLTIRWYNKTDDFTEDSTFKAGKEYVLGIHFQPKDGYYFEFDETVDENYTGEATFNGEEPDIAWSAYSDVTHAYTDLYTRSKPMTPTAAPTYTVTFDMNGHGTAPADQTVNEGSKATKPANDPTAEGWTFGGWYADATFSAGFDFNTAITADTTIYAKWTENTPGTYTVTFDANGGSVTPTSAVTGTDGKLVSLPTPTRSGSYRFNGWYTAANGGTKVTVDNVYTADTTIYAHWTYTGGGGGGVTYYTLTFNVNGGSAISSISGTYGKVIDLDKYVPTKSGYDFGGWYSDRALTSPVDEIKLTGNKTVYAKWTTKNPNTGAELPFTDVKTTDWSYEDIAYVYEKGLMQGTSATTFAPQLSTSRAMIVTILWRLEGSPVVNYAMSFTDVAPDQWYTEAVRWAQANGIVNGYSAEKFGTNDPITREQMAAILYRYAGFKGYDVSAKADLSKFADSDKIGGWAVDAIAWANANNLVNGVSATELAPQGKATREQVAAILHRFCENIVK